MSSSETVTKVKGIVNTMKLDVSSTFWDDRTVGTYWVAVLL